MDYHITNTMRKESVSTETPDSTPLKSNKLMLKLKMLKNSLKCCFSGGKHIDNKDSSLSDRRPRNNVIRRVYGRMKTMSIDALKVSFPCAVNSSSQGSGHDDGDAAGDVFIWGEGTREDGGSLVPKAFEPAVALDVKNVAFGGRNAALVTKKGSVFSWGEDSDVLQPKRIDAIEVVACGEYHTCAVTHSGDLYTWGDGTYIGHGNEKISSWLPKRVNGPLEGIHISSVSCGPWHTTLVTSAGQLFTFGDGTFGVLGHGDRTSVSLPREVESLKGLRTVQAACGVWHTAAVVEVTVGSSSSKKLFTWGDGYKGKLGHGDNEAKLVPSCVAAVVESNFRQVTCGHSMTVALTTSGHVYTTGSPVYGQLGNPQADGKVPTRVKGKLSESFVEEISCGAYHVAALTSGTEVYTWGKGAKGRLGHGNDDDENSPKLVEALKDKKVKSIACDTNFTAAICAHSIATSPISRRLSCPRPTTPTPTFAEEERTTKRPKKKPAIAVAEEETAKCKAPKEVIKIYVRGRGFKMTKCCKLFLAFWLLMKAIVT